LQSLVEHDPITPATTERPGRQKQKTEGGLKTGSYEPGITLSTSILLGPSTDMADKHTNQVVNTR
jgi:hypothetical protein